MSIQTDCRQSVSAENESPDYNFVPVRQIDFTSELEKNAFERYLDLREQLDCDRSRPVTVNDIIHTANLYMLRTTDKNICPVTQFTTTIRKNGSSVQVLLSCYDGTGILPSDKIYLIANPDVDKLNELMRPYPVKLIIPVQESISKALQKLGVPAHYDFTDACAKLSLTADEYLNNYCTDTVYFSVYEAKMPYEQDFLRILPSHTAYTSLVGRVKSSGDIDIVCGEEKMNLPLIKYSDSSPDICITLEHRDFNPGLPYIKTETDITTNSNRIFFVSSYDVNTASEFAKGYLSVVSMICKLASCGKKYTDTAYTFNNSRIDENNISHALNMVLGLFSAMLDFGITLRHCSDFISDDKCFLLNAINPAEPFVKPQTDDGLYVYRLTPLYNEYGLPDKDDFLRMLGYVSYLRRNKTVCSVFDTAPYNNPRFEAEDSITPDEKNAALPGSLYITANTNIEGRLLGRIKK